MSEVAKKEVGAAVFWVFSGQISRQLTTFVIGIVLARLLSPTEFGAIATANIFIAITYAFVDSGFASALIQKKDCSDVDYSTVFYFNLFVSILFYGLIFYLSDTIASFFNNDELENIIKALALLIILFALSSVQIAILKKELNFKVQTKIVLMSSVLSGLIGILLAYSGFGVWSLVAQSLLNQVIMVGFYWVKSSWRPQFVFSLESLNELFAFGSKLLLSGIIFKIYSNLSSLVIAKFYSLADLGFYNRAMRFQQLGSQQISKIVAEVTFPLFSKIQGNKKELLFVLRKSLSTSLYFSTPLSFGVMLLSHNIIIGIIGVKWSSSIEFLQLLSIYGIFYPFAPVFTNALMALGKSNAFLKLELVRRFLDIGVLAIGALGGITQMIFAMIIVIIMSSFYSLIIVKKFINYSYISFITDMKNTFIVSISIIGVIIFVKYLLPVGVNDLIVLTTCFIVSLVTFVFISELIRAQEYLSIKTFIIEKLKK